MEVLDHDSRTTRYSPARCCRSALPVLARQHLASKLFLAIFGLLGLVGIGPIVLDPLAHASLALLEIFCGLGRLALTLFQIFGM